MMMIVLQTRANPIGVSSFTDKIFAWLLMKNCPLDNLKEHLQALTETKVSIREGRDA